MWRTLLLLGCNIWHCLVPVDYYLYTPANPDQPQQLELDNVASVQASHFNVSRPTKIVIHGFRRSHLLIPNKEMRSAYLARGSYNIISMDWSEVSVFNYQVAKPLCPLVGIQCAYFLQFLASKFGLNLAELVLIGHSMGAHIAGFCGKALQRISGGQMRLGSIVALDAALPLYEYPEPQSRLSISDANYVMAVHTNGFFKGLLQPLGHADFYANGGRRQPGCGLDIDGDCSHARAVYIYKEAVQQLMSFKPYGHCSSYLELLASFGYCRALADEMVQLGDPLEVPQVLGIFSFGTKSLPPLPHYDNY